MNNYENKSFLELQVIWKDDDMMELSIRATNGRFLGTTEVYDTNTSLKNFAESLVGYPGENKTLYYDAGQRGGYSYFGIKIYIINHMGHVGEEINLEAKAMDRNSRKQKDKVKLEIIAELSAIDNFQQELLQLVMKEEGTATLLGIN